MGCELCRLGVKHAKKDCFYEKLAKTAAKTQHTPTPWTIGLYDASKDFKAIKTHVAICKPDGTLLATCGPVDEASKQDAAFIVRAVNAHEELLATAKAFLANCHSESNVAKRIRETIARASEVK